MQQNNGVAFTVVSDPGNVSPAASASSPGHRKRPAPPDAARLDLTSVNADGTVTLPMPATVILNASRTVRWIDVHPDYSTRTESRQVIDALDHLGR